MQSHQRLTFLLLYYQSVGIQNGDQSSTGSINVMENTPETAQIIENTSDSVPNIENTSQTTQLLKNIQIVFQSWNTAKTVILDAL